MTRAIGPPKTVTVAAIDLAVMFAGSTLLTPLYVLYQDAFHFTGTTLTAIYATYALGNVAALFLFGHISDRAGRQRITLVAAGIAGAATLVFLFANATPWLFVGRALSGLAIGLAASAATAWIADATAAGARPRASVDATTANFCGLALGALVAGLLAQYAPAPLRLSHVVYLLALGALAALIMRARGAGPSAGTSGARHQKLLRSRISLPSGIRGAFFAPAANAFVTFAVVGFYAALTPTIVRDDLHVSSLAGAAAIVAALFAVAAAAAHATAAVKSRTAMLGSLISILPSVALLAIAHASRSLLTLVVGVVVTGISAALGYRGSLQVVNEIAPATRRAEVLSTYQVVCFVGNALPVLGVGILAARFGAATATVVFAIAIGALAATAVALDLTRASANSASRPRSPSAPI